MFLFAFFFLKWLSQLIVIIRFKKASFISVVYHLNIHDMGLLSGNDIRTRISRLCGSGQLLVKGKMGKRKETIKTYEDLFIRDPNSLLSVYILGHLQIEFLLVKMVEAHNSALYKFSLSLTHMKLIELVFGFAVVPKKRTMC